MVSGAVELRAYGGQEPDPGPGWASAAVDVWGFERCVGGVVDGDVCSGEVFCVRFRDSRCEVGGCGGWGDGFLGWVGEDFVRHGACMMEGGDL